MLIAPPIAPSIASSLSGGAAQRNPVQRILGSNLLLQWDVRYGIASNTWTCQVRGHRLIGVNAPTFGVDGSNFGGLPVWQCVAASSQYLDTGSGGFPSVIAASATNYYMRFTFRASATGTTPQGFVYAASAAAVSICYFYRNGSGFWVPSLGVDMAAQARDQLTHTYEWGITAGLQFLRCDRGAVDTTGASGRSTSTATRRVQVAAADGGANSPADLNVAQILVCRTRPPSDQVTALDALEFAAFGIV